MLERPAVSTRVEVKFIVTLFKAKFMGSTFLCRNYYGMRLCEVSLQLLSFVLPHINTRATGGERVNFSSSQLHFWYHGNNKYFPTG